MTFSAMTLPGFVGGGRSWQGTHRDNNEDSYLVSPAAIAVADGVSGRPAGEIASATVIRCLASAVQDLGGRSLNQDEVAKIVAAANAAVAERTGQDPRLEGMATTLTALFRAGNGLILAHIGDSRAYRFRDGGFQQVTRDDSYVQELVDTGQITAEESARHPLRSVVLKVITGDCENPESKVGLSPHEMRDGDRWLIASDGLTNYVPHDLIERELASAQSPWECAESLIALAKRYDSEDNTTVVVCDIDDGPAWEVRIGGAAADPA
jgi:serine/threonine protein phosphatase PrpC